MRKSNPIIILLHIYLLFYTILFYYTIIVLLHIPASGKDDKTQYLMTKFCGYKKLHPLSLNPQISTVKFFSINSVLKNGFQAF